MTWITGQSANPVRVVARMTGWAARDRASDRRHSTARAGRYSTCRSDSVNERRFVFHSVKRRVYIARLRTIVLLTCRSAFPMVEFAIRQNEPLFRRTRVPRTIRRVITGIDELGRSHVVMDFARERRGIAADLWLSGPALATESGAAAVSVDGRLEPPGGGSVFRFFVVPPEERIRHMPVAERERLYAAHFQSISASHARVDTRRHIPACIENQHPRLCCPPLGVRHSAAR